MEVDCKGLIKKEIGSEFWNVPLSEEESGIFQNKVRWFISGTAALQYIIDDIMLRNSIKSVAIPSWCCNCIITPFLRKNIKVIFYPVYFKEGMLVCDYSNIKADCWIVISYFGYSKQLNIGQPLGIIIRDLTHSIFSKIDKDADYYFGSLRKWVGVYTGGYAWTKDWVLDYDIPECDSHYINIRKNAMNQKEAYINGVTESKNYLSLFEQGEDFLDNCEPMKAYNNDIYKALYLDYTYIKKQRRKNASILLKELKQWAIFSELNDDDCPLFFPIVLNCDKRNELRKYLINNNIYCPIHWPIEKEHILDEKMKELFHMELSIVCDQRYNEDDMKYIIKIIQKSGIL